jgi:ABC-type Co2+ transport system permease subunit
MHIADGIIATEIVIAADVFSAGALFIFGKKIQTDDVPKMGLMAAALFVVSLVHFGGLLSLGLNAVNMGAGAVAGYLIWKMCGFPETIRAFLAGFFGILTAAFLMALEFQLSGYGKGIFYILYAYVLVAGIEGVLTASIIGFFRRVDPAILKK